MRWRQQVVVVTGASSGIGRATALAFAAKGATVVCVARRADALEEVAAECRRLGAEAVAAPADVGDATAVEQVAHDVVLRRGRIDVWVNAAAVELFAPVDEAPVELWHRVVRTNVLGTFHGMRSALPVMKSRRRGVVVNVASVLGRVGVPLQSAYVASKFAVRGMSEVAREELADHPGVHVCTVLPAAVDTPIWRNAANVTGREVLPLAPLVDARRVADAIVRCARRPRREVPVGASGRPLLLLARLLPGPLERLLGRAVPAVHVSDRPAPRWDGSVLAPLDEEATVSGGWTRRGRHVGPHSRRAASHGRRRRLRLPSLVATAVAAAAWLVRDRRR